MAEQADKRILFLCTGNYYRSRFAEILFNSVAKKMGMPWKASSGGLALERGLHNVGPMSMEAITTLEKMGLPATDDFGRLPVQVTTADLERAHRIVALKHAEHLSLLQERFPAWMDKVEFWHIDDAPGVLPLIEREVMSLTARLIGGGNRPEEGTRETSEEAVGSTAKTSKASVVRVGRETQGRRGKGVTTISDLPLDATSLRELAAKLKERCGTGGTVKDGCIEIQGDQRERLVAVLEGMGYRVKRVGG